MRFAHVISASLPVIFGVCYFLLPTMATITSQVILHPYASQSLKLLSTTLGRDKLYRGIQYFARFLAWFYLSRGEKLSATRWNALKSHLGTGRKLMRLGKPMEHLQAALRATQMSGGELSERLATIARQLSYFFYLTYDAIIWANSVKFITLKPATAEKVSKISNRFWLSGILFSITHALLKAERLAGEVKKLRASQNWGEKDLGDEAQREVRLRALQTMRADTRYQFIIDVLDVWIPATNLQLVNFNDGVLGIFGTITSFMALRSQWLTVNGAKN